MSQDALHNWAGNYTYAARERVTPQSVEEVQAAVVSAKSVSALGSRHSFNSIADTDDVLISTRRLDSIDEIDTVNRTVTIGAGVTYGQLCGYLDERGFALHNLASLPHISVVGACMTGTHGSGERNGNLATAVRALEFVTAEGDLVQISRDANPDEFEGLVVGLGAYGVVTKATLDVLPRFDMTQRAYLNLPFDRAIADFDAIQASGYSVSLFTRWENQQVEQVWVKRLAQTAPDVAGDFFGATSADRPMHPVAGVDTAACTEQLGVPGAWYQRLPHFRFEFTPSHGEELQSEYFVPRERVGEALKAVYEMGEIITPLLYVTEIRTIAADRLWMSPTYGRDSVAIHFTWQPRWTEVAQILPRVEQQLMPFDARPHPGKLFLMPADYLQRQYPKLTEFRELVKRYDPHGKFRNRFLNETYFA